MLAAWILLLPALAPQDPAALVEQLRDDSLERRDDAHAALRSLGPAAAPALRAALRDPEPDVAARAAALLHLLELEAAIPPRLARLFPNLADRLAPGDPDSWAAVLREAALGGDCTREDLDFLAGRAAFTRGPLLPWVLETVQLRKLRSALPALLELAETSPAPDPRSLVDSIYALDAPPDYPAIRSLLHHPDLDMRYQAAQSLAMLYRFEPLSDTWHLLFRPGLRPRLLLDPVLRHYVVADLLELLHCRSSGARVEAIETLQALPAPEAAPDVAELLDDPVVEVAVAAIRYLAGLRIPEFAPRLRALLEDGHPCLAAPILEYFVAFGDLEIAAARSDHPEPDVRCLAIRALRQLRDAAGLRRMLRDPSPAVRVKALEALIALDDRDGILADLEPLMLDPHKYIQHLLDEALPAWNDPRFLPALRRLHRMDDGRVGVLAGRLADDIAKRTPPPPDPEPDPPPRRHSPLLLFALAAAIGVGAALLTLAVQGGHAPLD